MKNRNEFFNQAAEGWDNDRRETQESFRRVVKAAEIREGQTILDVGTGTGVLLPYINEVLCGKGRIYAIDYAEKMIEKLVANGHPPNVIPEVKDIHRTGYCNKSFDRVIANSCYPHFEKKPAALAEINRIMKADALFILSHPTGREFVNNIHKTTHECIKTDLLPEPEAMLPLILSNGFQVMEVVDEPDFFLMKFKKNSAP